MINMTYSCLLSQVTGKKLIIDQGRHLLKPKLSNLGLLATANTGQCWHLEFAEQLQQWRMPTSICWGPAPHELLHWEVVQL